MTLQIVGVSNWASLESVAGESMGAVVGGRWSVVGGQWSARQASRLETAVKRLTLLAGCDERPAHRWLESCSSATFLPVADRDGTSKLYSSPLDGRVNRRRQKSARGGLCSRDALCHISRSSQAGGVRFWLSFSNRRGIFRIGRPTRSLR